MVDRMLRFFTLFILSVSCCSAFNASSPPNAQNLLLPRIADLRKDSTGGFERRSLGQILARGISQDLSCPDGFLCVQQACPSNILCPAGETCVNFEGTSACAVPGPKICALNPNTFQAVACNAGTCCHGNCYTVDAVCCDFPSIECTIGGLCNACTPGQTCGNNQCAGGTSSTTSTTTTTSVIVLPPSSPPPSTSSASSTSSTTTTTTTTTTSTTSTTSTTTSTTTTTTTSATTSSTTSTTSTAPTPTIVTSSGDYTYTGCFFDAVDPRVLVAGSKVDLSSTGMTVEKCIAFANSGAFQYAGVEFGGECYVGNTLHGASASAPDNCNQACAGNPLEVCGGGNRISIYTDPTWHNPTAADLVTFLQQYTDSLSRAQTALANYRTHLEGLRDALANNLRVRVVSETVVEYEMQLLGDVGTLRLVEDILAQAEANGGRLFLVGASNDIPEPIVNGNRLSQALNLLDDAASAVSDAASAASDDSASISESIAGSTAPLINIPGRITTVVGGIQALGLPAIGAAVATGLFLILGGLLAYFLGGANSGGTPDPPCTTITVQACAVGCSVTNFGDSSTATTCYTTSCSDKAGCGVRPTTTTTATTTSLCALTTASINPWIPVPGALMPFLGGNNAWTTPI